MGFRFRYFLVRLLTAACCALSLVYSFCLHVYSIVLCGWGRWPAKWWKLWELATNKNVWRLVKSKWVLSWDKNTASHTSVRLCETIASRPADRPTAEWWPVHACTHYSSKNDLIRYSQSKQVHRMIVPMG